MCAAKFQQTHRHNLYPFLEANKKTIKRILFVLSWTRCVFVFQERQKQFHERENSKERKQKLLCLFVGGMHDASMISMVVLAVQRMGQQTTLYRWNKGDTVNGGNICRSCSRI